MSKILIAEDHSIVRKGIALLIHETFPKASITEAETLEDILSALQDSYFDLLILDIHIPGGDSLQMIQAIHLRQSGLPILVFSSYDEQLFALQYLRLGVRGYIHKRAPEEEVRKAITSVMNGEKYMSEGIRDQLMEQALDKSKKTKGIASLSSREIEIMQLLVKGVNTSEIKSSLNIADSTLSTYKSKILEKLNVSNIVELAEKVRQISN